MRLVSNGRFERFCHRCVAMGAARRRTRARHGGPRGCRAGSAHAHEARERLERDRGAHVAAAARGLPARGARRLGQRPGRQGGRGEPHRGPAHAGRGQAHRQAARGRHRVRGRLPDRVPRRRADGGDVRGAEEGPGAGPGAVPRRDREPDVQRRGLRPQAGGSARPDRVRQERAVRDRGQRDVRVGSGSTARSGTRRSAGSRV